MSTFFESLVTLLLSWKFWLALVILWGLIKVRQDQIREARNKHTEFLAQSNELTQPPKKQNLSDDNNNS